MTRKPLTEYQRQKRKALTINCWSEAETQFPLAYEEVIKQFGDIRIDRVLAFDFKVWLKPVVKKAGRESHRE